MKRRLVLAAVLVGYVLVGSAAFAVIGIAGAAYADPPAQASQPTMKAVPARTCYSEHCEWTAKPNEAVKGAAKCLPGYVSDHLSLSSDNGTIVHLCVCCPAIDPPPTAAETKKEK